MRILLFTGKGGVGKTTVAAGTALACAEAGLRTLVLSTDPAHSLADAFDAPLGSEPTMVADRLYGQQLDATERLEEVWGDVQSYLTELLGWAGVDAVEAEELAVVPGLDEIFALSDIKAHADSGAWDLIVVDCAPTAETIRLLSLPDILSWYMERIFPVERRLARVVRPLLSRVTSMPVAGDDVFAAARRFYDRLDGVRELLTDPACTSVRLVVNPERMVIAEARRTYTYLSLFGYRVDAVIANRLLPEEVSDPWFKAWKDAHAEHLADIEVGFAPVPVLRAELASEELIGADRLLPFAAALYGAVDPAAVLHESPPLTVEKRGDDYVLALPLPGLDPDELEVGRVEDELFVRVGAYRRALVLPDSLRRRDVSAATVRDGQLEVSFTERSFRE
ncbi:MAG: arsenite/tail-anchored protein-transporting ATPase [Acidimicrobiaceae bacterium]|nr:arsenite/tail-anchored protein-transporting ATPase [Acidimicrobiaceae bacterium]